MDMNQTSFIVRMGRCLANSGYETYVRENWENLNSRIKNENETTVSELFKIHMGAFDDLRMNGHRVNINDQPLSVLAAKYEPQKRFDLACQYGRSLIKASSGLLNRNLAIMCSIDQADYFPNCIAIGLAAILQYLHPGFPEKKMAVICSYETYNTNNDPLGEKFQVLEKCFQWVEFRTQTILKE